MSEPNFSRHADLKVSRSSMISSSDAKSGAIMLKETQYRGISLRINQDVKMTQGHNVHWVILAKMLVYHSKMGTFPDICKHEFSSLKEMIHLKIGSDAKMERKQC